MPIVEGVCALLAGLVTVQQMVGALMSRPLRTE
jgi:hypothetical protein